MSVRWQRELATTSHLPACGSQGWMGSPPRPEHSIHFTQPCREAVEWTGAGGGPQWASGGVQGGSQGAPAVELKGSTTSNVGSEASEPAGHTHRDADRSTERQRDAESLAETHRPALCPPTPSWDEAGPAPQASCLPTVSGGPVGPCPRGESQASVRGLFWGTFGWGPAMRRSLRPWAAGAQATSWAEFGRPSCPSGVPEARGAWFQGLDAVRAPGPGQGVPLGVL